MTSAILLVKTDLYPQQRFLIHNGIFTMVKPYFYSLILMTLSSTTMANIIVDTKSIDTDKYHADMYECQQLAGQVEQQDSGSMAEGVVGSSAKGAALGAAGVAIAGGHGTQGAKVGASLGLTKGVIGHNRQKATQEESYQREMDLVMRNCISGRGYTILN